MEVSPVGRLRRRPSAEVHARLSAAGLAVFAALGYEAATTRAIAEEADVAEALIFSHFGSKAGLFQVVVRQPVESVLDEVVRTWRVAELRNGSRDSTVAAWARELLMLLRDHREPLRAWIAGRPLQEEPARMPKTGIEVRAAFAMALSVVVLDRWMWSGGEEPPPNRLTEAVVALLTWGVVGD